MLFDANGRPIFSQKKVNSALDKYDVITLKEMEAIFNSVKQNLIVGADDEMKITAPFGLVCQLLKTAVNGLGKDDVWVPEYGTDWKKNLLEYAPLDKAGCDNTLSRMIPGIEANFMYNTPITLKFGGFAKLIRSALSGLTDLEEKPVFDQLTDNTWAVKIPPLAVPPFMPPTDDAQNVKEG